MGEVETQPEATKFIMLNNSGTLLLNVTWNGTHFGDLGKGLTSEQIVQDGGAYIFFEIENGEYRTRDLVIGEKYKSNRYTFFHNTNIVNLKNTDKICLLSAALTCGNSSSSSDNSSSSSSNPSSSSNNSSSSSEDSSSSSEDTWQSSSSEED